MGAHDPARTEGREGGDALASTDLEPPPTCPPSAAETVAYISGQDRLPATDPAESGGAPDTGATWEGRQVGRYRIVRTLGQGAFGRVYLGRDEALGRDVAIKVPHAGPAGSTSAERRLAAVLAEARKVAGLKHMGLVGVLEVGQADAGDPFLVLEYVEGPTLEALMRAGRIDPARLAGIVEQVAAAIHHAHVSGLVHRDLKPSNILIDPCGAPHVADFGLALAFDPLHAPRGQVAGTFSYMAPEQVRGESHRLDGRTDVWALGVVLYRGLTGHLPFPGRNQAEIVDEILHREPLPPRQIDDTLPRELERIGAKCLAARMVDRYQTAADLAEDLRRWRESAAQSRATAPPPDRSAELTAAAAAWVAPRGLHAFDAADAAGFLALLPGPRGFDGMPESLRFWKAWAERDEPDASVGLLYGPSGGGKSSFVRAGLLPRLDSAAVCAVAVEATPEGTEAHLLAALRRVAAGLPEHAGLAEAMAEIRAGRAALPARKLLIVIDQFEQWLQAHPALADAALADALRQCDGERVQALVLVRDDFWMAVSRFFQALEVPLVERVNSGAIELLDARHARGVLQAFGRACGRLTGPRGTASPEEGRFLDAAAAGLAEADGRVVPVRLSLFIEVVRRRTWTPGTLRALGGFDGTGVRFLEEAFDLPTSPPAQKARRRGAQAVLQALLPPPPSLIRRAARPAEALRAAAGLDERPDEFAALLRILDGGLRLIAAADPEGLADEVAPGDASKLAVAGPSYRLAHDYLVGPVRQWIDRKAQATRAGRARLLLASTAVAWTAQPSARRLPSLVEWATIAWHVPRREMTADERRMMRAAARHYGVRFAAAAAVAVVVAVGARAARDRIEARERYDRIWTDKLDAPDELFRRLDPYRDAVAQRLAADERAGEPARRAVASALLYRYEPAAQRGNAVVDRLLAAPPGELAFYRGALASHLTAGVLQRLWSRANGEATELAVRLRAAAALAALDPHSPAWAEAAPGVVASLRGEDRADVRRWAALLDPVGDALVPALNDALRSPRSDAAARLAAVEALIELQTVRHSNAAALAELLADVPGDTFLPLVRAIQRDEGQSQAVAVLARTLEAPAEGNAGAAAVRRQVQAVAALAALGDASYAWPRLADQPDPLPRSLLIAQLAQSDLRPQLLIERIPRARDAAERQGVLLVLAEMAPGASHWSRLDREHAAAAAAVRFADDADPGVHSAAELLLRRLDQPHAARGAVATGPQRGRGWFVGPNGHTFAVVGPLEGWVGTPPEEPGHHPIEARHYVRTGRSLAVATAETTVAQYRAFLAANPDVPVPDSMKSPGLDPEIAAGDLLWYEALRYCNWLSREAGLALCYPELAGEGMTIPADVLDRSGFRLPTEAEWELLCRHGTRTARPFGDAVELLPRYAWTWLNSDDRVQPVARLWPTRLGLFDVIGNQWEWCHDGSPEASGVNLAEYPPGTPDRPAEDRAAGAVTLGPNSNRYHRGGAYDYAPSWARSGSRDYSRLAGGRRPYNGLRVVRTIDHR